MIEMENIVNERRAIERVPVTVKVRWNDMPHDANGWMLDLSTGGCFIEAEIEPQPDEQLEVAMLTPIGNWVQLPARVVYQLPDRGFGLRFKQLSRIEQSMLEMLLEYYTAETHGV